MVTKPLPRRGCFFAGNSPLMGHIYNLQINDASVFLSDSRKKSPRDDGLTSAAAALSAPSSSLRGLAEHGPRARCCPGIPQSSPLPGLHTVR